MIYAIAECASSFRRPARAFIGVASAFSAAFASLFSCLGGLALLVAAILFAGNPASAAVYYVNDTSTVGDSFTFAVGDDANNGLSPATPLRTLDKVDSLLAAGDTVYVDAGIYWETTLYWVASGVSFIGKDSNSTVIDFLDSTANIRGFRATNLQGLTLRDLAIRNARVGLLWTNVDTSTIERVRIDSSGVQAVSMTSTCQSNAVLNSQFTNSGTSGIQLNGESHVVRGNTALNGRGAGFSFTGTGGVFEVTDNVSLGNQSYGFFAMNRGHRLARNTASRNGGSGFNVEGNQGGILEDNVATDNASNGFTIFRGDFASPHIVRRNVARNNGGFGIEWRQSTIAYLTQNTCDSNASGALHLGHVNSVWSDSITRNNFLASPYYPDSLVVSQIQDALQWVNLTRNWWGSTDSTHLKRGMTYLSWSNAYPLDSHIYLPFRLGPVDTSANADTVAPRAPDTVAAVALGGTSIRVTWSTVTASEGPETTLGLAGYSVFRSRTPDTGFWERRGTVGLVNSYDDSGLSGTTAYYYRVTAFDDRVPYRNESFFSDSIALETTPVALPDTSGPNAWYVNDTSTVGDSFTSAVGYDTNHGLSPSAPLRTLNALLWRLTAGDTVYMDSGTWTESFVVTADSISILGAGRHSTILAPATLEGIKVWNRTNVTIRDLGVHRPGLGGGVGGSHGLSLDAVVRCTIRGVRVYSAVSDAIRISGFSRDNRFTDNEIDSSGAHGIRVDGDNAGTGNVIDSNVIRNNRSTAIYLSAADSNVVTNNRMETISADALITLHADTNWIAGNVIRNAYGSASVGLLNEQSYSNRFFNNVIDSVSGFGIYINAATSFGNLIDSNVVLYGSSQGIRLNNADSTTIRNNRVVGSLARGLSLDFADSCMVSGNAVSNVTGASGGYGMEISNGYSNLVTNNVFDANSTIGIHLTSAASRGNTIDSNLVSNNGVGITLGTCALNRVTNNVMISNWDGALSLVAADTNLVSGNILYNARGVLKDGLSLETAHGNVIRNNRIDSVSRYGVSLVNSNGNLFEQNEIARSAQYAVFLSGTCASDTFRKNTITAGLAQPDSLLWNATPNAVDAARNWWGTSDTAVLGRGIRNTGGGSVSWRPFRLGAPDTTPGADTVAPRAPDTVAAVVVTDTVATISWSPVTANEDGVAGATGLAGYRIHRAFAADSPTWILRGQVAAGTLSFQDSGLGGVSIHYRVTAFDNASFENQSFYSESVASLHFNSPPSIAPAVPAQVRSEDTAAWTVDLTAYQNDANGVGNLYWRVSDSGAVVHASVTGTATLSIAPIADRNGTETVTLSLSDRIETVYQHLVVTLTAVNDTPIAVASRDSAMMRPTETTTVRAAGTTDSDADHLTYAWAIETGTAGSFSNAAAATTAFLPNVAYSGTYVLRLTVTDSAGALSIARVSIFVDGTPPAAFALSAPADGHETTNTTLDFSWGASSDTGSGLGGYTFQVIGTGGSFAAPLYATNAAPGSTTIRFPLPGSDTYRWRLVAYDNAGNTTAATARTILVDTALPATPRPTAPVGAAETTALNMTFRWTASSDSHSGLNHYRLQVIRRGGSFDTPLYDGVIGAGLTETTPTAVFAALDTYLWRVWAVDDLGNASTVAWIDSFVRRSPSETVAPLPVTRSIAQPLETGGVVIAWDSSPSRDVVQYLIYWDSGLGGNPDTLYSVVPGGGAGTFTTPAFGPGLEIRFRIVPVDSAGNLGTPVTVTVTTESGTSTLARPDLLLPRQASLLPVNGLVQVVAQLLGTAAQKSAVTEFLFQYRRAGTTPWQSMNAATVTANANPLPTATGVDDLGNYRFVWNTVGLAADTYEIRAVSRNATSTRPSTAFGLRLVSTTTESPTMMGTTAEESTTVSQQLNVNRGETITMTNAFDTQTAQLVIPPGAFTSAVETSRVYILVAMIPRSGFDTILPAGFARVLDALRVTLSTGETALAGNDSALVTLSFRDVDGDGFVDGTRIPWRTLRIYRHSGAAGSEWELMPTIASQDPSGSTPGWLRTWTRRFSVFQLVGAASSSNLANFTVTPNPFRPNDGDPGTGEEYTGAAGTGIYFLNVPTQVRIEIYTILGRKVVDYQTRSSNGQIQWDVRNDDRQPVASGVYLYVVTDLATNEQKTGKMVIMR